MERSMKSAHEVCFGPSEDPEVYALHLKGLFSLEEALALSPQQLCKALEKVQRRVNASLNLVKRRVCQNPTLITQFICKPLMN